MDQVQLKKYLEIIQDLLTCPGGEEWVRLKYHEDWVNSELVQVMEQVAAQLTREGNQEAARFLYNWSAKLHHILVKAVTPATPAADQSPAYLALIKALLNCPEGTEQQILAQHQDLIGPGLVQKMHEVAQQLKQQGEADAATYLYDLALELNQIWSKAHAFQPDWQKEVAISLPKVTVDRAESTLPEQARPAEKPELTTPSAETLAAPVAPTTTRLQLQVNQQLAESLREITQAIHQLNETLTAQRSVTPAANNPLWYMEALEQAYTAQWLLTTEEVEQLIGVKPRCHGDETVYQRGTWQFVKVGKLGTQTAWRVVKARLEACLPEDKALTVGELHQNGQVAEGTLGVGQSYASDPEDTQDLWAE